jgi:hypothetical protein
MQLAGCIRVEQERIYLSWFDWRLKLDWRRLVSETKERYWDQEDFLEEKKETLGC